MKVTLNPLKTKDFKEWIEENDLEIVCDEDASGLWNARVPNIFYYNGSVHTSPFAPRGGSTPAAAILKLAQALSGRRWYKTEDKLKSISEPYKFIFNEEEFQNEKH